MLYHITDPELYLSCIEKVKYAFWPYENDELKKSFKNSFIESENDFASVLCQEHTGIKVVDDIQKRVNDILSKIITKSCNDGFYSVIGQNDKVSIPFLDKYHTLFLKRKWEQPYCKPSESIDNLLCLASRPFKINEQPNNYSLNSGNYFHFVNVVAILSHLIYFFSDNKHNKDDQDDEWFDKYINEGAWSIIKYDTHKSIRKFKLMLAGFFHDIGKTVVDHRHAMEGYMILSSYQSKALLEFILLSGNYKDDSNETLDREDLLFIADLIYYHDLYGTLSTGENGYMRLINLIERVERYSRREGNIKFADKNKKEILSEIGKQNLFDLWLLNVADIIASVGDKWNEQHDWTKKKPGDLSRLNYIREFFNRKKTDDSVIYGNNISQGNDLLHDLKITFDLFGIYLEDQFANSTPPFKPSVLKCSYYHNVARIRRLVKNSLFPKVTALYESNSNNDMAFFL